MKRIMLMGLAAVLAGCLAVTESTSEEPSAPVALSAPVKPSVPSAPVAPAPVKAALYIGKGTFGIGAYSWLEIAAFAEGMETKLVDGAAIQAGALDDRDILIMPGGSSWTTRDELGTNGAARVKAFIRRGGGYVGTCAGAFLVSESSDSHRNMLNLVPFTSRGGHSRADMMVRFNSRAKAVAGITPGRQRISYAGGPVFTPSLPVADSEYEILATYDSNINTWTDQPFPSMAGQAAVIAGRCGKGRIFISAVHPESDPADHYIIRGAFRFLTGRDIAWTLPTRTRGQLAIGVDMAKGMDLATAVRLQALMKGGEYDLRPVISDVLYSGTVAGVVTHLDRVIKPVAADLDALPALKALPSEAHGRLEVPARTGAPVKVASYTDKGGVSFNIVDRLALSSAFEVTPVTGADIAAGALKDFQMLLQPGGWSPTQYRQLGTNGCAAIDRFIRDGGSYYGICAGAFLASQTVKSPRANLIPWKDVDETTYRGWGPIRCQTTAEGLKYLGNSNTNRYVIYWGGPVFDPGTPIEGADVKPWVNYWGYNLCTSSPYPVQPMTGRAAILGGTLGKGKVFISGTHPEKDERTFDIVDSGIAYLTGVRPDPVKRNRARGALSVALEDTHEKEYVALYLNELIRDHRFDVRIGWDATELRHLDVVVTGDPYGPGLTPDSALAKFVARGGVVIVVVDTPAKAKVVEKNDWVVKIPTMKDIPAALARCL